MTYQVRTHDPKATPADGNRLSVLNYRQTEEEKKAKKAKKPAKCVEIPALDVAAELEFLHNNVADAITELEMVGDDPAAIAVAKLAHEKALTELASALKAFNTAALDWQDNIIRSLVDDGGASDIHEDRITFAAIIAHANAENAKKRMSKEGIGSWFEADMMPGIIERLTAKNMLEEQQTKIITDYAEMFARLASVAPKMAKVNTEQLLKLTKEIAPKSTMKDEIVRKLDLMLAPAEVALVNI